MSELQDYVRQLDAVKTDAQGFVPGLADAQFQWRPEPGRWSVAECLDHLNVSVRATFPAFDRAMDEARAKGLMGQGPFKYGRFASWMIGSMEPPPKRRFRTFKVFMPGPTAGRPATDILSEFLAVRDGLIERLRRAEGLDLKRAKVTSPASRFFRMSLGAYFAFVIAHDRRHLWQARQVMAAPGFPQPVT